MATNLRKIDGGDIVARIKSRHGLKDSDRVGVFGCFDTKAALDNEGGNNDVLAVATTDAIDLDDEVVVPSGCDLTYLNTNRKLFVDHYYDADHCVASMRSVAPQMVGKVQRGWKIRARLLQGDIHQCARLVESIIAQDGIGLSIGFLAMDCGRPTEEEAKAYPSAQQVIRKARLLEVSFTCLPCNVSCQTMGGVQDTGKSAAIADRLGDTARKLFRLERPRLRVGF